jgi:methionine-rich copper-binding protein CopC
VGSAYAHAEYQLSEPGDGAVVAAPPERIDIWFTQELFRRQGDNRIQVFDPGGQPVQTGDVQIDNDDRKHMWVVLETELKPGVYRVDWNNISAEDGHPGMGSFSFTFDPEAAFTPSPLSAATSTGSPGSAQSTPTVPAPQQTAMEPPTTPATIAPNTQPASSGGGCIPGMVPAGGLAAAALILARRRSVRP